MAFTVVFVLFAEVLVFIPSVSRYRIAWLEDHVNAAYLATLSLEAAHSRDIDPELVRRLLKGAAVEAVSIRRNDISELVLAPPEGLMDETPPGAVVSLDRARWWNEAVQALSCLFRGDERLIRAIGAPMMGDEAELDIMMRESALRKDMIVYGRNVLGLSLVISLLVAGLIYLTLSRMVVWPLQRFTAAIAAFQDRPEDADTMVRPSGRGDELGEAERVFASMQAQLRAALRQRARLAALGAGMSKVSHDLRNVLASAQLISDRLVKSEDPRVARLAPRLVQALDRAISLCRDTLAFGRADPDILRLERFPAAPLFEEIAETVNGETGVDIQVHAPDDLILCADRIQLFRILYNLVRNAAQAVTVEGDPAKTAAGRVVIGARRAGAGARARIVLSVTDTGPGVPEAARAHMFEPFRGSVREGGTGLGLAIASEIARAHGGEVRLAANGSTGATFEVSLPDANDHALPSAAE